MLSVTEEQKRMFYASGYSYNYVFHFPETELIFDNDQLHSEEMTLQESICDEEDLKLGGCIASSIEFVVSEIMAEEIAGLSFTAEIEVKDEDGLVVQVVPMGTFTADAAEQMNDKDYKKVTAYDYMYEMSVDVSEWYNTFFSDGAIHTVKETREALLEYLGASYIVQTLPNDDVLLEKTVEPNGNLTGTELLRSICEINGAFGRMNREGFFEEITLHGLGLYPEDALGENKNLYPEETLYPEDDFEYLGQSDGSNICPQWRSTKYEEYMTLPITCLNIQSTAEDVGVTVGDDLSNPYVITSNMLLYGKGSDELKTIGSSILSQIKGLTYRPNTTELDGLPYLECGDSLCLTKKNDTVESHIFSRTLKGIQALIDTFEAKGNKMRANEVTANEEIRRLKGKTLQIRKEIENFSVKLTDVEKNTESLLDMTASTIVLQVQKDGKVAAVALDGSGDKVSFTVSADNVFFEGDKIDLTTKKLSIISDNFNLDENGNLSATVLGDIRKKWNTGDYDQSLIVQKRGNPWDSGLAPSEYYEKYYLDIETGVLYQVIQTGMKYNWSAIEQFTQYEEVPLQSQLNQTYDAILLQVESDGSVVAMSLDASGEKSEFVISADNISLKGKRIDLTADGISLTSDKLNIGTDGSIECASFRQKYELGENVYEVVIENGNIECTGKIETTQIDCNLADIDVLRVDGCNYHNIVQSTDVTEALIHEVVFTAPYDIADKTVHVTNMDIDSQPNAYPIGVSVSGKQIRIRFANTITGTLTFGITYWDMQP